jgi:hypothetical protein
VPINAVKLQSLIFTSVQRFVCNNCDTLHAFLEDSHVVTLRCDMSILLTFETSSTFAFHLIIHILTIFVRIGSTVAPTPPLLVLLDFSLTRLLFVFVFSFVASYRAKFSLDSRISLALYSMTLLTSSSRIPSIICFITDELSILSCLAMSNNL